MKKTVVKKREAVNAMRKFVNNASSLTYCGNTKKSHITMRKDTDFAAKVYGMCINNDLPNHTIYYNFEQLKTKPINYFRTSWSAVDPIIKGFADVTIALLHELGHLHTQDDVLLSGYSTQDKNRDCDEITKTVQDLKDANQRYFSLKDEMTATMWAIDWLHNAKNRKMAKAFEKKFFACCEQIDNYLSIYFARAHTHNFFIYPIDFLLKKW